MYASGGNAIGTRKDLLLKNRLKSKENVILQLKIKKLKNGNERKSKQNDEYNDKNDVLLYSNDGSYCLYKK